MNNRNVWYFLVEPYERDEFRHRTRHEYKSNFVRSVYTSLHFCCRFNYIRHRKIARVTSRSLIRYRNIRIHNAVEFQISKHAKIITGVVTLSSHYIARMWFCGNCSRSKILIMRKVLDVANCTSLAVCLCIVSFITSGNNDRHISMSAISLTFFLAECNKT